VSHSGAICECSSRQLSSCTPAFTVRKHVTLTVGWSMPLLESGFRVRNCVIYQNTRGRAV
jgi:hypothetical protein